MNKYLKLIQKLMPLLTLGVFCFEATIPPSVLQPRSFLPTTKKAMTPSENVEGYNLLNRKGAIDEMIAPYRHYVEVTKEKSNPLIEPFPLGVHIIYNNIKLGIEENQLTLSEVQFLFAELFRQLKANNEANWPQKGPLAKENIFMTLVNLLKNWNTLKIMDSKDWPIHGKKKVLQKLTALGIEVPPNLPTPERIQNIRWLVTSVWSLMLKVKGLKNFDEKEQIAFRFSAENDERYYPPYEIADNFGLKVWFINAKLPDADLRGADFNVDRYGVDPRTVLFIETPAETQIATYKDFIRARHTQGNSGGSDQNDNRPEDQLVGNIQETVPNIMHSLPEWDYEELVQKMDRVRQTGMDLSNADLFDTNLEDVDLTGAKLKNADLRRANLKNTALYRANLTQAKILQSQLTLQLRQYVTEEQIKQMRVTRDIVRIAPTIETSL